MTTNFYHERSACDLKSKWAEWHIWYPFQVAAIEVGPGNDTYETLCYREAGECAPYGVLSVWGGDESLYRATVADDERFDEKASLFETTWRTHK